MKHKLLWALGGTVGFTLFPKIVALVSNSLHVGLIPKLIVDLQQLSQEVKPTYLYSTMASDGSPRPTVDNMIEQLANMAQMSSNHACA